MSAWLSICLFLVVTLIYIVLIDVFTIYFRMTGMPEEKARFQVISLLTNSGYTTNESEIVLSELRRRKMARGIMLFGYIFSVTIIAMFINVMITLPAQEVKVVWPEILTVCAIFVAFLVFKRIPVVKAFFSGKLEEAIKKRLYGKEQNIVVLLDNFTGGVVAKVFINHLPQRLESAVDREVLTAEDVHLIFLERDGKRLHGLREASNVEFQPGDIAAVFGSYKAIEKLFEAKQA